MMAKNINVVLLLVAAVILGFVQCSAYLHGLTKRDTGTTVNYGDKIEAVLPLLCMTENLNNNKTEECLMCFENVHDNATTMEEVNLAQQQMLTCAKSYYTEHVPSLCSNEISSLGQLLHNNEQLSDDIMSSTYTCLRKSADKGVLAHRMDSLNSTINLEELAEQIVGVNSDYMDIFHVLMKLDGVDYDNEDEENRIPTNRRERNKLRSYMDLQVTAHCELSNLGNRGRTKDCKRCFGRVITIGIITWPGRIQTLHCIDDYLSKIYEGCGCAVIKAGMGKKHSKRKVKQCFGDNLTRLAVMVCKDEIGSSGPAWPFYQKAMECLKKNGKNFVRKHADPSIRRDLLSFMDDYYY